MAVSRISIGVCSDVGGGFDKAANGGVVFSSGGAPCGVRILRLCADTV